MARCRPSLVARFGGDFSAAIKTEPAADGEGADNWRMIVE